MWLLNRRASSWPSGACENSLYNVRPEGRRRSGEMTLHSHIQTLDFAGVHISRIDSPLSAKRSKLRIGTGSHSWLSPERGVRRLRDQHLVCKHKAAQCCCLLTHHTLPAHI